MKRLAVILFAFLTAVAVVFGLAFLGTTPVLSQNDSGRSPRGGFAFLLELDGKAFGYFTEVSGLGSESDVVEYREGSEEDATVRKLPGRLKYGDITLKRGLTEDLNAWKWRKLVEDGFFNKALVKHGALVLVDHKLQPVARWEFKNVWPSKVWAPLSNKFEPRVGFESLTLVHEYLERVH